MIVAYVTSACWDLGLEKEVVPERLKFSLPINEGMEIPAPELGAVITLIATGARS
jgi:hypothetical protein